VRAHVLYFATLLVVASFCLAMGTGLLSGCGPAAEPPRVPPELAAEASYGAALNRCVDKNDTEAEIDACANDVRRRWSTDGGAR
jgi:hypothetical protein